MKLKLAHDFSDKYKKGHVCEIDNIMRAPGECASGVKVRIISMSKQPQWWDLGWFVPPVIEGGLTKRAVGRLVHPAKKNETKSTNSSVKLAGSPSRR